MKNYQFKKGQHYKVIKSGSHHFVEGKVYEVRKTGKNGENVLLSEAGTSFTQYDFDNPEYVSYNTTLLLIEPDPNQEPFKPTIEIDFLIDYIQDNDLTSNEIIAFLKGYKKGEEFIHEKLN